MTSLKCKWVLYQSNNSCFNGGHQELKDEVCVIQSSWIYGCQSNTVISQNDPGDNPPSLSKHLTVITQGKLKEILWPYAAYPHPGIQGDYRHLNCIYHFPQVVACFKWYQLQNDEEGPNTYHKCQESGIWWDLNSSSESLGDCNWVTLPWIKDTI